MGLVYRVEDRFIGHPVTAKLFAPCIGSDEEIRERFDHAAQAATAMDHLTICRIYEIDEAEGRRFIAMEFVAGENVENKIERGPLNGKTIP